VIDFKRENLFFSVVHLPPKNEGISYQIDAVLDPLSKGNVRHLHIYFFRYFLELACNICLPLNID